MRLGKYIQTLTKPELEELIEGINCTDDENEVIQYMRRGYSNVDIADRMCIATSTVSNRIRNIQDKIERWKNGKRRFDG